ncbi:NAD-dependent epimerase/dehydratase family protein [Ideonella sp.]|uniref:NAD-dependent epimerase/dehydratase family protein n=1 Tax=Ideonella sp. TaxID=1929293 RepID=UPI003BB6BEB3
MNILITGGAGFIGSHLVERLAAQGHCLTILDNLSPQIHGLNCPLVAKVRGCATLVQGDVRERTDWLKALEGQEAVVHLAAETGTGQSMYEIDRYVDVNIRGTGLLLDLLANRPHKVRKLLIASSRSIYGEGKANCPRCGVVYPTERPDASLRLGDFEVKCPICSGNTQQLATDEGSKLHPSSIYGITKLTQEQLFLTAGRSLGIPATALRYQNVYGPGQSLSNPYTGILSIFSTRIRNGNGINIFEDGLESRDFVYIDDVIDATVAALMSPAADHQVFNVGSGVATDVMTVARTLCDAYGTLVPITVSGNYRLGDIRHNHADLSLIAERLGYAPKVDFAKGVHRFTQWVLQQETAVDAYQQSIDEMKRRGLFN